MMAYCALVIQPETAVDTSPVVVVKIILSIFKLVI